MKTWIGIVMVAILCLGAGCGDKEENKVLKFSAIPDKDQTLLKQKFDPVAKHLSEVLGVDVEYVPASSYDDALELFKNGKIQLAWFGGLTGVQAMDAVDGARAIAQGVEDPTFYSYFIAHESTGLTESDEFPKEIEGKKFTFGSRKSTSGRLMPEFFIREAFGKSPAEVFAGEPNFSGDHQKTCTLVADGQFEVGAVNYVVYDNMVSEGKIDPDVCRKIYTTPTYADYNFTAHPKLEEMFGDGFIDKLQSAVIGIKDEKLLKAFDRTGLIKAKNEDFQRIVDIARDLEFLR